MYDDVNERPHAGKSTVELLAVARWLDQHVRELCIQRAMIRTELVNRGVAEPPAAPLIADDASGAASPLVVSYRTAPLPRPGGIGDPYADAARRYSLRITVAAAAVIVAACAGLLALATL